MEYYALLFPGLSENRRYREENTLTEKELKKLNRYQLLELLIIQTERADELERKLEEAQKKLDSREVEMTVIGSIAEASLHLSGVFEAAQNAADSYVRAVQERTAVMEAEAVRRAETILETARQNAQRILQESQKDNL